MNFLVPDRNFIAKNYSKDFCALFRIFAKSVVLDYCIAPMKIRNIFLYFKQNYLNFGNIIAKIKLII